MWMMKTDNQLLLFPCDVKNETRCSHCYKAMLIVTGGSTFYVRVRIHLWLSWGISMLVASNAMPWLIAGRILYQKSFQWSNALKNRILRHGRFMSTTWPWTLWTPSQTLTGGHEYGHGRRQCYQRMSSSWLKRSLMMVFTMSRITCWLSVILSPCMTRYYWAHRIMEVRLKWEMLWLYTLNVDQSWLHTYNTDTIFGPRPLPKQICYIIEEIRDSRDRNHLLPTGLVAMFKSFALSARECMDPLDYVYGVLGLFRFDISRKSDPNEAWHLFISELENYLVDPSRVKIENTYQREIAYKLLNNCQACHCNLMVARNMRDVYQCLVDGFIFLDD